MNSKKPISSDESVGGNGHASIAPFVYQPAPGWTPEKEAAAAAIAAAGTAVAGVMPVTPNRSPGEEELKAIEQRGWDRGFREGLAKGRAENEAAVVKLREEVAKAIAEFGHERHQYFYRVEGEVVSLALAVVRKILHRESQVDPLLLTGLVRVALDKMTASQNVRLRVHPRQIRAWQDYYFGCDDSPLVPEFVADAALDATQCIVETDHGTTDLHIEAQMKEIEQGFFDLLAQRPAPK
jgi:flagellar assembly protein FliH